MVSRVLSPILSMGDTTAPKPAKICHGDRIMGAALSFFLKRDTERVLHKTYGTDKQAYHYGITGTIFVRFHC
jgi:hypothetical protein